MVNKGSDNPLMRWAEIIIKDGSLEQDKNPNNSRTTNDYEPVILENIKEPINRGTNR